MSAPSDPADNLESLRQKIIGLGEHSIRKSYYPELRQKLTELERFRALLDQSNDIIFLMKVPSAEFIDVNESACSQLLYDKGELISRSLYDLAARESYERLKDLFENRQSGLLSGETFNSILRKKTGDQVPVEVTMRMVAFSDSLYAVAAARDISERVRAEAALRESEEKYRTLFEESKDVIFFSNPEGKFLDINVAGLKLFGYSTKEEIFDINIERDLFVRPEDRKRYQLMLHEKGFVNNYEVEMKNRRGERLDVLITSSVVKDPKGESTTYRGVIRDITEHKRLEQQLLQAQKMEAVGQLAGGVAHDFNNILTAIIGYSSLLQMKTAEEFTRSYVNQILTLSGKAATLTQSLLAFSRKQIINPRPTEINEVVRTMGRLLMRLIGEDIELKMTVCDRNMVVFVDSGQIEQVLMNLATNARDAMPNGGTLTIATSEVTLDREFSSFNDFGMTGKYALITVSDTGIGMDEKIIGRIFEPFFTTKEVGKGTGLGLAMAYGIIEQHKGFITAYSEPGRGTIFKIYLPEIQLKREEAAHQEQISLKGGNETILLAEDEAEVRSITKSILQEYGYNVIEAANGEEAVSRFIENRDKISFVLSDLIMPRKNGRELYKEILAVNPHVKILFTSGYTADAVQRQGLLDEGLALISKPVSPKELLVKIREMLDSG